MAFLILFHSAISLLTYICTVTDPYDPSLDVVDEKFITKNWDILISLTGSHITQPSSVVWRVGRYTLQSPSILNQRAWKLIIKDESIVNQLYLYYVAYNPVFRYKVASFAQWSASQANVSPWQVESIEISLPPLAEQQRIASILSAYDDLIENNTRRISLLEQMAQTLYRQWFIEYKFPWSPLCSSLSRALTAEVQEGRPEGSTLGVDRSAVEGLMESGTEFGMIPQGWEVKNLYDIANIQMWFAFKSNQFNNEWIWTPAIRIRDILNNYTSTYTDQLITSNDYIVNSWDILIGMDWNFYLSVWAGKDWYLVQRVCKIKWKDNVNNLKVID